MAADKDYASHIIPVRFPVEQQRDDGLWERCWHIAVELPSDLGRPLTAKEFGESGLRVELEYAGPRLLLCRIITPGDPWEDVYRYATYRTFHRIDRLFRIVEIEGQPRMNWGPFRFGWGSEAESAK